jgi:hypothetical protein
MSNPIDDAFATANARANQEKREKEEGERQKKVYASKVGAFVESLLSAFRAKAEKFRDDERVTNKPTVSANGFPASTRRASDTGMQDRRVEVNYRQDEGRVWWTYEALQHIALPSELVASEEYYIHVVGDELRLGDFESPGEFADAVLDQFQTECIEDQVAAANR